MRTRKIPGNQTCAVARTAALVLALIVAIAWESSAQEAPIPPFAADVRAGWARFKGDAGIATVIGVTQPNIPTRGLAVVVGAHAYPLRTRKITIGIGGEVLASRGSRSLPAASATAPSGPTVRTHFSAVSPQLSFNFGKRDGWSYVSGGLGRATFFLDQADQATDVIHGHTKSLNYGGGARWFTKKHVAFAFDLRWYALSPRPATDTSPAFPRTKNMVFTAGVGFRL